MTITAGAGPTGPGGPTHPGPTHPPAPAPPSDLAAALDTIDQLLRLLQLIHADKLTGADPAGRLQLASGLRTARRAVAALQTPARQASSRLAAVAGGPDRAGRAPTPGAGTFSLPPIPTVPSFDNGPVPWPGRSFPVYEVPAP